MVFVAFAEYIRLQFFVRVCETLSILMLTILYSNQKCKTSQGGKCGKFKPPRKYHIKDTKLEIMFDSTCVGFYVRTKVKCFVLNCF